MAKKMCQRKHKVCVRKLLCEIFDKDEYYKLVLDMKLFDHELLFRYFQMLPVRFEEPLSLVGPSFLKICRNREPISSEERLSVTLCHIATGDSHAIIVMSYHLSPTTVQRVFMETCQIIRIKLLNDGLLKVPSTQKVWKEVTQRFELAWNFPICVVAIDAIYFL